jgi:hypothetical protein
VEAISWATGAIRGTLGRGGTPPTRTWWHLASHAKFTPDSASRRALTLPWEASDNSAGNRWHAERDPAGEVSSPRAASANLLDDRQLRRSQPHDALFRIDVDAAVDGFEEFSRHPADETVASLFATLVAEERDSGIPRRSVMDVKEPVGFRLGGSIAELLVGKVGEQSTSRQSRVLPIASTVSDEE